MVQQHHELPHTQSLFGSSDVWLGEGLEHEIIEHITDTYDEADRQVLLEAAVTAAIAEEKDTYTLANPQLRNVARNAVRYALGLKPLPQEQQGEEL